MSSLTVPKALLTAQPTTEITAAERAVAWEIASALDERRTPVPADGQADLLRLDLPAARLRGPSGRDDNQHLHRVLRRLAAVQWHDQDPDGRRWVVQLIAQAEITPTGDTVTLLLPPRAITFLRTPGQFARLEREAAHHLPPNARALYGLLADRFAQPDKLKRHEAEYGLDELKGALQLGGRYPRFADFRKRVLAPSVKAINDTGALAIYWEPVKLGRSMTAIRFKLRFKEPREANQAEREQARHSQARGKAQESADAPPLMVVDQARRWLEKQGPQKRIKWSKRAAELGAESPTAAPEHVERWVSWVATELVETEGLSK